MRVLVYVHRSQSADALALVARLRAEGVTALHRDTRGFAGDIETCDRVVTDDPHIAGAHAARGIDVAPFTTEQASAAGGGDDDAKDSDGGTGDGPAMENPPADEPVKRPRRARKRK